MSDSSLPSSAGFSGRGYLILYQDGTVRAFGNAPGFSFSSDDAAVAIAIHPDGTGLAGVCKDGTLLYAGTAASLASSLKNDNPFVDLVYAPDGNGLWGLDNDCGVWHAGTAQSIGYGSSQGDCIRLAMYSSTEGVVIDSHGHLYRSIPTMTAATRSISTMARWEAATSLPSRARTRTSSCSPPTRRRSME